jgi:hypothetical protein
VSGPGKSLERSQQSLDFEQLWRALPRQGRVPSRQAFKPKSAKALLPNLMLLQAPDADNPALRIRLVGNAIRKQIGRDVLGEDYLEFMGEERRDGALQIVQSMFELPCGIWWIAPVHYERDFSQYWEMTAFPLAGDEQGPAMVLGLVRPADTILGERPVDKQALRVDLTDQFKLLEIDR